MSTRQRLPVRPSRVHDRLGPDAVGPTSPSCGATGTGWPGRRLCRTATGQRPGHQRRLLPRLRPAVQGAHGLDLEGDAGRLDGRHPGRARHHGEAAAPRESELGQGLRHRRAQPVLRRYDRRGVDQRITSAHKGGPPAIVIHCAMHTYRASTNDTWREFLGVTTRRHTKAHNISGQGGGERSRDHEGLQGRLGHAGRRALRARQVLAQLGGARESAVSPEDQKEYPLAWTSDYGGTRIFGTTLGHGNDTWNDPGVPGSARARVQVDAEARVDGQRLSSGTLKGDSHG